MKLAHQIKLKVFSYGKHSEDDKLILGKLLEFFPFDLEEEKIELKKTGALGMNENQITIYEVVLTKEKHISRFLENLKEKINGDQKKLILDQLESRLDENLDFFIRIDKDEYVKNGKLKLTDSGNCFHLKMSIAAFPKKRDIALGIVNNLFKI